MIDFQAESGNVYSYDEADRIGDPGSYGTVYGGRAEDGTSVAVKVVSFRASSVQDRAIAEREVEVWRRLPVQPEGHLVPLLDVARATDQLMFVMPRARRNLAELVAQSAPLTTPEATDVVRQVAEGLRELAEAGVIHRDIKPLNILDIDNRWHLADFGISRVMAAATASHTLRGGGTMEYRAPELFVVGAEERVASDLYAIGCIGYELVTGRKAFPGPDHRHQHLTVVPQLPESVQAPLRTVILDMLAKEPSARPPDARRVVDVLKPGRNSKDWQLGVQRMLATTAERRMKNDAKANLVMEYRERQRQGRLALKYLWGSTVDILSRDVPDVIAGEDRPHGFPYLIVGDFRLMLKIFELDSATESMNTLYVGSLVAMKEGDMGEEAGVIPANMVCAWNGESAQWHLLRFAPLSSSPNHMMGSGAKPQTIFWNGAMFEASDRKLIHNEVADPHTILDMFNEAIGL
ncbi:serine/threonine protein kinase [Couchioplanes caeruleus]|uniref:serine/threonine-protein kinase n=1 Tax=Couchioplanes caeruleus TaxID=56438 RepID=UPI0020BF09C8|nr:serine/threonine-protein kinase [Couchioplanes caeruleus]UQU67365.1 serine/threonine protein kinase [Couchioplanes caeruleus]